MKLFPHKPQRGARRAERASVLIIVLWVAIGLISITLYFANSMTLELRASDNRTSGLAAEQAIEGTARYVSWALYNYSTNGTWPTNADFICNDIPIGDAKAWIIGRSRTATATTGPAFGLVDEAGKLNLNTATTNALWYLPGMDYDLAYAITDWRNTNGSVSLDYSMLGYDAKFAPFETVDELRLIDGMTMKLLVGDDANRNGILDSDENALVTGTTSNPGLLEYTTVYSREPNANWDGSTRTNVNSTEELQGLLTEAFGSGKAQQVMTQIQSSGGGGGNGGNGATTTTFNSLLGFYLASGLSETEFDTIYDYITASTNDFTYGRVNVNTASEAVLVALFIGANVDEQTAESAARTLVSYRELNPNNLGTIAWIVSALGSDSSVVQALASQDLVTTRSYQYSADIAAVGPYGRGYRRVKFVFDTTDGTPKIIYRQDLSRLGWALGNNVRETLMAKNTQ